MFLKVLDLLFCKRFVIIIAEGNNKNNISEPFFIGANTTSIIEVKR